MILPATYGDENLTSSAIDRLCLSLGINVDLRGADHTGANLDSARVQKANLCGAKLGATGPTDVDLACVDLHEASVKIVTSRLPIDVERTLGDHALWVGSNGADGKRADLAGQDMGECDLTGAWLNGGRFTGCNFAGAMLRRAQLVLADFSGADLSGADLREADVKGTNFEGANLEDARLSFAKFGAVALTDSNGEVTGEYWWTNFVGANLRGADLANASLVPPASRAPNVPGCILNTTEIPR